MSKTTNTTQALAFDGQCERTQGAFF